MTQLELEHQQGTATEGKTMETVIRIKPARNRKPIAPRTCCPTHTDTCRFGREHQWVMGWHGGPLSGVGIGEPGWHDSTICVTCKGVCVGDLEDGGRA